jgi:hypothetical protein
LPAPRAEPLIEDLARVALHGDVAHPTTLHEDLGKSAPGVLDAIEVHELGNAKAGSEEHGKHRLIAQPLVSATSGAEAERLRGGEEAGEVSLLGIDRARRLAGELGDEVDAGERLKTPAGLVEGLRDVMFENIPSNYCPFCHTATPPRSSCVEHPFGGKKKNPWVFRMAQSA